MSLASRLQVCVEIGSKTRLCVWARGGRAETADTTRLWWTLVDPAGGEPDLHTGAVCTTLGTLSGLEDDGLYV